MADRAPLLSELREPPAVGRDVEGPTAAMIEAGRNAFNEWHESSGITRSEAIWRAMTRVAPVGRLRDAALKVLIAHEMEHGPLVDLGPGVGVIKALLELQGALATRPAAIEPLLHSDAELIAQLAQAAIDYDQDLTAGNLFQAAHTALSRRAAIEPGDAGERARALLAGMLGCRPAELDLDNYDQVSIGTTIRAITAALSAQPSGEVREAAQELLGCLDNLSAEEYARGGEIVAREKLRAALSTLDQGGG